MKNNWTWGNLCDLIILSEEANFWVAPNNETLVVINLAINMEMEKSERSSVLTSLRFELEPY